MKSVAYVMNVFYTGLGIARSLGEKKIPVVGLSAHRRSYGNFTRYAKTVFCPDSRLEPEALADFLLRMGKTRQERGVIFPTRDDDVIFLDRFRKQLEPYFSLVIPERPVLDACLNKWTTIEWAWRAGVPAPDAWMIENPDDLERAGREARYPCVLKPVSAHHWRQGDNWTLVGARKAVAIHSQQELREEYRNIARADTRALLQEMVTGPDTNLFIAACYVDRQGRWVAGFNTQKLLQVPEGFGTGCIVQSVDRPELLERTKRLLETMGFSGIAEVEYKWDSAAGDYQLIEINPRPWDQHRLGHAASVDLIYLAYCDHAGLPIPAPAKPVPGHKWIAEDTLMTETLRSAITGDGNIGSLLRLTSGKRIYGIWSAKDPLPSFAYFLRWFLPMLIWNGGRSLWRASWTRMAGNGSSTPKGVGI